MAEKFETHMGRAAVILRDNIDTDQIIPSREMKTVGRQGLSAGLFAGWRYLEPNSRDIDPSFVLNQAEQIGTSVLISGANFGCGSSREHAAWALKEYGIRVIVAKSFGEIFHGNCVRNGILPVTLTEEDVVRLASLDAPIDVSVNLQSQSVSCPQLPDWTREFEITQFAKKLLIEGLDPIALTLRDAANIEAFFAQDQKDRPWVYSAA